MQLHMRRAAFGLGLVVLGAQAAAQIPVNDEPLTEKWAPSEWGPTTRSVRSTAPRPSSCSRRSGSSSRARRRRSARSTRPSTGVRHTQLEACSSRARRPAARSGRQQLVYNDEFVTAELGQIGTQFDGPGHIGVITSKGDFFYNGRYLTTTQGIGSDGMGPLGVEHVAQKGFVCRGVLLDAVALRGGQLPIPKENSASDPGIVTAKDVEAMVKRQGIAPIGAGDCVFLHTGHGDLWHPQRLGQASTPPRRRSASRRSTPASRASASPPASTWPSARSS